MRKAGRKALSLVLSVYMALSVGASDLSIASYAAEEPAKTNHLWTKVDFDKISADDSIAITMTSGGVTYVLPNAQSTKTGPLATAANVDGDTLSITDGNDSDYAWKITKNTVEVQSKDIEETGAEPDEGKTDGGTVDKTVDDSGKTVSDVFNVDAGKSENDENSKTGDPKAKDAEAKTENQGSGSSEPATGSKEKNDANVTSSTQLPNGNNGDGNDAKTAEPKDTDKTGTDNSKDAEAALNTDQPEVAKKAEEASGSTDKENLTVEEYYTIFSGNNYLYTNAANNGVRISDSKPDNDVGAKWKIDDGYLCTEDSKNAVRYLGVYSGTDFRAYTKKSDGTIANNIKGQTLAFYKLTDKAAAEGLLAPTASVKSGEAVESGTEITLSCATTGAKIYFNTNGTENFSEYKEPIKITEDTTIYAYSTKDNVDSEKVSFAYTVKKGSTTTENTVAKLLTREFYDGDVVVVYYPADKKLMTAKEMTTLLGAKTGKFDSEDATPSENKTIDIKDKNALVLKVSVDENGKSTLKTEDGKYLTATVEKNGTKTNCALKLADSAEEYSTWTLQNVGDAAAGKFILVNDKAKSGSYKVALEYYKNAFTSYGIGSDTSAFEVNFYALEEGEKVEKTESDKNTELIVAQWAGNANYDEAGIADKKVINGDLYSTNDMLDENAKYSVVVGGEKVKPYTAAKSSTTGSTSYYMGATGVVNNTDYIQMEFPTLGYADMKLSFRMRSSNTAVGAYQLQYSATGEDGSFKNFSEGSYSYKYTTYRDNKPSEVSGSKQISDGIAKTSLAPTNYVEFSFKIPDGANNKEKIYVRFVPATTLSAKGDKDAGKDGTNRIDTVIVSGHPVVSDKICGHVIADPASGEIEKGAKIALLTGTEGADIYYSINGAEEVKYDAGNKITVSELPAIIRARAVKEGLKDSVTCVYQYTQAQVATVKATPNGGAIAANQKITLSTKTENAKIFYRYMTDEEIEKNVVESVEQQNAEEGSEPDAAQEEAHDDWIEYSQPFEAKELPAQIQVKAVKEGYSDSVVSTLKYTKRTNERENIYFGQVHAHTNISDGAGSLEDALSHASKVDNLDFIIITDHSNSIDNEGNSKITENVDTSENDEWTYAHNLVKKYTTDDFTCAYGYEMTWSNGLGHMNTFNTKGFQSRTQKDYSTYSTALNNYYAALRTAPDSISQFNHPGTTFGDFQDFAYYSEENDALITMIEVGNGEGAIGSSGYFPSYEYYTRALDKGWHVAPTNNQDNHKGLWGDANTARTVMLADTNSEEAIYDAMRNYRIYATEDNDLSIYYTLDNNVMGSILDKDTVGETVEIKADIKDPTDSAIGKVEVVVNGGQVIASQNVDKSEATVTFTVPSAYSYYYLKISEQDKDIAVTAPVWVGSVEACGINNAYTETVLPVAGESLDINVDLFNNEKTPLEIKDIEIELSDVDGKKVPVSKVTGAEAKVSEVASNGTASYKTSYVYNEAGQVTYEVTVHAMLGGIEKIYKDKFAVNYAVPKMVSNVIIDGTHYNDYVSGYYTGNVNAFINLCAKKNIRATVVKDNITSDMLKDCKLLVLSAPGKNNKEPSKVSHYSDDFIKMVKEYVAGGGSVIVCGLADYSDTKDCQTATEQNKILEAIGATIRMGSDEVCDDKNNGGQVYRMYPTVFNKESALLAGIKEGQKYSQYSGCSVDISNAKATNFVDEAEWLVNGFETTYSVDCKDGAGNSNGGALPNGVKGTKLDNDGKVTFIARQKTKAGGQIIVSGGVFLSDFEVKAEMDNNDSLPYANHTIVNNIIDGATVELETTTIAKARQGKMNEVFAVEGYVTSGTENQDTTFFDTIYIQDETGGMDIFPYATPGLKIGTKMRIVGFLAQYQGDLELKVLSAKELKAVPKVWEPKAVDTKTAMDYDKLGGQLLKTTGDVTRVEYNADGTVAEFWLKDSSGAEAAIFIDGYIRSGSTGKNTVGDFVKKGAKVTAAGVLYKHPEGKSDVSVPVLRVRNCDDIVLAGKADAGATKKDDKTGDKKSDDKKSDSVKDNKATGDKKDDNKKSDAVKDNRGSDNKKTDNKKSDAAKDNKVSDNKKKDSAKDNKKSDTVKDNKKSDNKKSEAVKDNKGSDNKKVDNKKSESVKDNKNTDNKKTDNKKSESVNGKKKSDNTKKDNSVLGAKKKQSDNKAADSNKKDSSDNSTEAKSTDADNSSTENEDNKDSAQTADSQTDNGAEQDKQEDNGKKKEFKLPELPNIPKKFVAIGAGAVGVVALVIFVISHIAAGVSAGAAAGASAAAGAAAASGGKLAGLLSKIRHLFGKK
ncbi:MAG: CehA/McbA family metallohydrolase [Butyrivibrio hungatei]|nr:CehA/McbA family metallohydrolase [Butyrivibrio hungatei]